MRMICSSRQYYGVVGTALVGRKYYDWIRSFWCLTAPFFIVFFFFFSLCDGPRLYIFYSIICNISDGKGIAHRLLEDPLAAPCRIWAAHVLFDSIASTASTASTDVRKSFWRPSRRSGEGLAEPCRLFWSGFLEAEAGALYLLPRKEKGANAKCNYRCTKPGPTVGSSQ